MKSVLNVLSAIIMSIACWFTAVMAAAGISILVISAFQNMLWTLSIPRALVLIAACGIASVASFRVMKWNINKLTNK